ncbi:MAG: hypothetical protein GQ538_03555 [Xanthomonadales bacterium]|nr:hypothetical protein [Xanthomonadales bacterium]
MLRFIRLFNVIILSMLLSACATTRQAYLPAAGYGMDGVNEGDNVKIVMNDGKKHSLLVTRVDEIGLHGNHDSFAYSDMQSVAVIEKRQTAGTASWIIIGLTVIAVALLGGSDEGGGPFCLYASNDPNRTCL